MALFPILQRKIEAIGRLSLASTTTTHLPPSPSSVPPTTGVGPFLLCQTNPSCGLFKDTVHAINPPNFKKQNKTLYPFLFRAPFFCFSVMQNSWISCLYSYLQFLFYSLLNLFHSGCKTSILLALIVNPHSSYLNWQQHLTQVITPSFLKHFLHFAFRTHTFMVSTQFFICNSSVTFAASPLHPHPLSLGVPQGSVPQPPLTPWVMLISRL